MISARFRGSDWVRRPLSWSAMRARRSALAPRDAPELGGRAAAQQPSAGLDFSMRREDGMAEGREGNGEDSAMAGT